MVATKIPPLLGNPSDTLQELEEVTALQRTVLGQVGAVYAGSRAIFPELSSYRVGAQLLRHVHLPRPGCFAERVDRVLSPHLKQNQ